MKPKTGIGYAWKLEEGSLCHWAEPDPIALKSNGKPSPNAKVVRVRLVLESDWRKLIRRK